MTVAHPVPQCCVSAVSLDNLWHIISKLCPPTGSNIRVTLHNRGHENAGGGHDFFTADVEAAPGVIGDLQFLEALSVAEEMNRRFGQAHNSVQQLSGIVWKLPKDGV